MNKKEILKKLNKLKLNKDKIIIISGASLVVQGIIEQTPDIDLATSEEYYKQIKWQEKLGAFGKPVKYFDCFEISNNLYDDCLKVEVIDGFKFLNLKDILKIKKILNRKKDEQIIKRLEEICK